MDEIAVILVYQPKGIPESVLLTLTWFAKQGVAPIVVSNCPLSEGDRERLAPTSHLLIERPNMGYDFGGYREGIMTLLERGGPPRALYVLNDSMWFPLNQDCEAVSQARVSKADLFGFHLGRYSRRAGKEYLQSYFFRFGVDLLNDPAFSRYWRKMALIDAKRSVVRRYERKLTEHFTRRGYSVDAIVRWDDVIAHLLAMDDAHLTRYVEFQRLVNSSEAERLDTIDAGKRDELDQLIRERRLFVNLSELHPALLRELGAPFLKKGGSLPLREQRRIIREEALDRDFSPSVRAELAQRD